MILLCIVQAHLYNLLVGDLINKIELNSEIRIEKAYVTKFRDNLQLNLGFYGKLFLLLNNTESV